MAHGQPDFGMYAAKKTVFGQVDIGELAARLGSVDTYDRSGDVIWIDDFESGVEKWKHNVSAVDASIVSAEETARNGSFCAKLTAGDTLFGYANMLRTIAFPVLSKISAEFSFTVPEAISANTDVEVRFHIDMRAGKKFVEFHIKYDRVTHEISYMRDADDWVWIDTKELISYMYCFHQIKIVVDFETGKYVRLSLDDSAYDLSDATPKSRVVDCTPSIDIRAWISNKFATENPLFYVDDVIIKQNEP